MSTLRPWLNRLTTAIVVVTLCVGLAYAALVHTGHRMLPVLSGSMEPTIGVGSLTVVKPVSPAEVGEGDVVTFKNPQGEFLTTHRIHRVRETGDETVFVTKGDAVADVDPWRLRSREGGGEVGKVLFDIPYVGYALVWLHSADARTLLLWGLAGTLVVVALMAIWRSTPRTRRGGTGGQVAAT